MADAPDRTLQTLEEILERVGDVGGDVKLLRQEFSQHAQSDAAHFGELKAATSKHTDSIHDLQIWRAGLSGAKQGASPWIDGLTKLLIPLLLAGLLALGGAFFAGR